MRLGNQGMDWERRVRLNKGWGRSFKEGSSWVREDEFWQRRVRENEIRKAPRVNFWRDREWDW